MKKLIALMLALVMALALTAPALAAEEDSPQPPAIGCLAHLGMDADEMAEYIAERMAERMPENTDGSVRRTRTRVYYNSLSELLMALDAGLISTIEADEPTVQYVLSLSDSYAEHHPMRQDSSFEYSMCFEEDDTELRDQFNEAITAMKDDGTLDALAEKYIDGVIDGEEMGEVEFPSFDGAETVTVAVTGDLPPMDYVDEAGYAAGYNTALLAEISNRLGVNIQLMQVDSSSRALALASGRADVVFWVQSTTGERAIEGLDIPEGTITSEPYYTAGRCSLVLSGE